MFSPTPKARPGKRSLRDLARSAVDTVVSFALLEDVSSPPDVTDARERHPHPRHLEPPARMRRPGATPPRTQDCLTPLAARARQRQQRHLVH